MAARFVLVRAGMIQFETEIQRATEARSAAEKSESGENGRSMGFRKPIYWDWAWFRT